MSLFICPHVIPLQNVFFLILYIICVVEYFLMDVFTTINVHTDNLKNHFCNFQIKGELWLKMNLWSNKTLVPSQPFSEILSS